jgi:hypothetical protein
VTPAQQLFFYFMAWIICWISGFGVSILLLPINFVKNNLVLIPTLFGAFFIALLTSTLNYLGWPVYVIDKWVLLFLTLISIISFIKVRKEIAFPPEDWVVGIICFLAGIIVMLSLLLFKSFNPYNDTFTYVSIADYLVKHKWLTSVDMSWGNDVVISQVNIYKANVFRMASQFLLAFFTSIFQRPYSLEMYLPVAGLGAALFTGGVSSIAKYVFNLSKSAVAIAALFTAIHWSFPIGDAAYGFFPMTWGLTFFTFVISYYAYFFKNLSWKVIIAISLLFTAVVIMYSEVTFFLIASLCMVLLYQIFFKHEEWKNNIFMLIIIILLGMVFSNYGIIQFIHTFLYAYKSSSLAFGWVINYTLWQYWTELLSIAPWHYGNIPSILYRNPWYLCMTITALAAVIICLRGFQCFKQKDVGILGLALLCPFFIAGLYYGLIPKNPFDPQAIGMAFIVYKVVQYAFYLVPSLLVLLWTYAISSGRIWRIFGYIAAFMVLTAMIINIAISLHINDSSMKKYTGNNDNPISEYYKLVNNINSLGVNEMNIIIPSECIKHRQYIGYFLRQIKLIGNWSDDEYIANGIDKKENREPDPKLPSLVYKPSYPYLAGRELGANMVLVEPGKLWFMNFTEGWYGEESDDKGNTWHWANDFGTIKLDNVPASKITLEFDYMVMLPNDKPDVMTISSDQDEVKLQVLGGGWIHQKVILNACANASIVFKKPSGGMSVPDDPRILGFAIRNLKITFT